MMQENPELPTPPPSAQPEVTAPVVRQPRWSGKKTAVAAALAIGLSSAGAITASAAVAGGTGGGDGRMGGGGLRNMRTFEGGAGGLNPQQQDGNSNPGGSSGNSGGTAGDSQRKRSSMNAPEGSAPGGGTPSGAPTGAPAGAGGKPAAGADG